MLSVVHKQQIYIFSQVGLQQHYRIRHRGTELDDNALKDGMKCLRKFAANETKENLIDLSQQRKNSVQSWTIRCGQPTEFGLEWRFF